MELIVGAARITPTAIRSTGAGVEAVLQGQALLSLLDCAFHGAGTIEILGGEYDRHRMEVTGIDMHGAETRVTLACIGTSQRLH